MIVLAAIIYAFEVIGSRSNPFGEWGSLAHSQTAQRWALQIARFGPHTVTFVLVIVSSSFGYAWVNESILSAGVGVSGLLALGALTARSSRRVESPLGVHVAGLMEADTSLFSIYLRQFMKGELVGNRLESFCRVSAYSHRKMLERTRAVATGKADLVVWAEGAGIVAASQYDEALNRTIDTARETGCIVVASWLILDPTDGLMSNITTVITANGRIASSYAKSHPVPGPEADRTRPDHAGVQAVETSFGRLAVIICFDADHAESWRQLRDAGVDVVAIPASDWPAVGSIHADMSRLRARSIGAAIIRPARDGVSTVVNSYGTVVTSVDHRTNRIPDLVCRL